MAISIDELLHTPTKEEVYRRLTQSLQGLFPVYKEGEGTGTLTLAGMPGVDASVRVEITTTGTLATARLRYSLDGGANWAASDVLVPASGQVELGATGVTLRFAPGRVGAGTSFVAGDTFAFALATPTFPVRDWQPGAPARVLVEVFAVALTSVWWLASLLGRSGFARYAKDRWLDLVAEQVYGLPGGRRQGTVAKHKVRLTAAPGAGPYNVEPGKLWVQSTSGLRFVNDDGGTLVQGGTLELVVSAESVGARYNVALGSISRLITSLAGVTVANIRATPETALVQQGTNRETNEELYARCQQRWPSLAEVPTDDLLELWARTISDEVTRLEVYASLTVPGEVDVYLAGPSGGVGAASVAKVQEFLTKKVGITRTVVAHPAIERPVDVAAKLYARRAFAGTVAGAAEAALVDYLQTVPISGTVYDGALVEQLMLPEGMVDVALLTPGDIALGRGEVAVPGTFTLSVEAVD